MAPSNWSARWQHAVGKIVVPGAAEYPGVIRQALRFVADNSEPFRLVFYFGKIDTDGKTDTHEQVRVAVNESGYDRNPALYCPFSRLCPFSCLPITDDTAALTTLHSNIRSEIFQSIRIRP